MEYIVVFVQDEDGQESCEGCDYCWNAIGLGIDYEYISADGFGEACALAKLYFLENYTYGRKPNCNIKQVIIAEKPTILPVDEWWREEVIRRLEEEEANIEAIEAKERAELARLLEKYNK